MDTESRREEILMADVDEVSLALVARGVRGLFRIGFGEARYRANDPDTWLKWVAR